MNPSALESAESWIAVIWWVKLAAAGLVALGVAMEFGSDWVAKPFEKIVEDARKLEVAKLTNETARLSAEAKSAGAAIAQANARAAEADQKAQEAALELAKFRSPRFRLLQAGSNADILIKALAPFAGTKFDVGHENTGREQWDFLWVLEPLFAKAGWIFVDWVGPQAFGKLNWTMEPHVYGVANVLNVSIELSPEYREKLLPAAQALVTGLKEIGIAAQVEDHPISGISNTADAVHVLVGSKD